MKAVGDAIEAELTPLLAMTPEALRRQRADRFYAIGKQGVG
jgi:acetyl-CoA carboxylase carboxyl transferase subunit alpha